jgi:hypothetical protein
MIRAGTIRCPADDRPTMPEFADATCLEPYTDER